MSHKPTKEQERIYHFVERRPENLLIEARAGTGKTHVLVEAIKLIPPDKDITFLAFNKHIQEELKKRLPEYVRCYTCHGLGFAALKRKYGKSIEFNEYKADQIIQKKSEKWNLEQEFPESDDLYIYLNKLKKLTTLCRVTLTMDAKYFEYLAERHEIIYDEEKDKSRVLSILEEMMNDRKTFDFTDMVFLPAIDKNIWFFPQDYVAVDEGQDISMAQQRMIEKMLKKDKFGKVTGRLIVVADPYQNIYSFAGANEKSFQWFRDYPNMEILPLTTTFRCAKNIVLHAQNYVKDIQAMEDAPDGIVREGNVLKEAESGDFVLCRTTMPLVKLFFYFLMKEKKATIKGSDIGISLIEMIGKIKTIQDLKRHWQTELFNMERDLKRKGILNIDEHSGYSALQDKILTLLFLSQIASTIPELKLKISEIFTDEIQGIVLSSIHKAKGLESNRVFIVRPDLLPMKVRKAWQAQQEKNLCYVAYTRPRLELIFDYNWTDLEK